jgi:ribose-phosphate pyrophosphokinase
VVSGEIFAGDADGRTVLILDDLISTGHTLQRAAKAVRQAGARRVIALVTHGLFASGAANVIADPAIDRFVVTDTTAPFRLDMRAYAGKITVLPAAGLFAEAVRRVHETRTLDDLYVI